MLRVTVSWLCLTVMYLTVDMFRRTELTSGRVSFMSTARGSFMAPGEVVNVLQVSKKYFSFFVCPIVGGETGKGSSVHHSYTAHARKIARPMPVARLRVFTRFSQHATYGGLTLFLRVSWPAPPSRAFVCLPTRCCHQYHSYGSSPNSPIIRSPRSTSKDSSTCSSGWRGSAFLSWLEFFV